MARRRQRLNREIPRKGGIRKANGEQVLWRATPKEYERELGSRYKIAASNEEGGRSLTLNRLVLDELRQHHDYTAYSASVFAANAVPDAQIYAISNAGSVRSVVLNDMREAALDFINTGVGDPRLGLLEYSSPEDASPLDLEALAQANPNLGRRIDPDALLGDAITAVKNGGEQLASFQTENMCITVRLMKPAINPVGWTGCRDVGTLDAVRERVAAFLDLSRDGLHATLAAAAVLPDGRRVRVEIVKAWSGATCAADVAKEIGPLLRKMKPRAFGWMPNGPAAAVAAALADRSKKQGRTSWPPPGVVVEEIRAEVTAVCMGFASLVDAGLIAHSDDGLLNAHVEVAEPLWRGDAWLFTRRGPGHVDAVYAVSGAAHLARTLPASVGKPRLVTDDDE
jgi:hypothetical protein